MPLLNMGWQWALDIKRRVRRSDFFRRAVLRVQVDRNGLSRKRPLLQWQVDTRKSMPGILVGLKHHAPVEQRIVARDLVYSRVARVGVNLERAAPLGPPFRIEIDDQVQAPMKLD